MSADEGTDKESGSAGVSPMWLGGVLMAGVGLGLGFMALTLPWCVVRYSYAGASRSAVLNQFTVTQLGMLSTVFSLILVVAAVWSAMCFMLSQKIHGIIRAMVSVCGAILVALVLALGPCPSQQLIHSLINTGNPLRADPAGGFVLFVLGLCLMFIGVILGASGMAFNDVIVTVSPALASIRAIQVRRVSLVLAAPVAVVSLALPWYGTTASVDTTVTGVPPIGQWQGIYRVGIFVVAFLVLLAWASIARRASRYIANFIVFGLFGLLVSNAIAVWDPSNISNTIYGDVSGVRLGTGYDAAVIAVGLLLVGLTALSPVSAVRCASCGQSKLAPVQDDEAGHESA
ncbi:MAG TPA: hypothetical protein VJ914_12000 [Pseudonocardiaceae bacterium]|nr:hypothetical protein [Pseudonocardiaceae bacterium]